MTIRYFCARSGGPLPALGDFAPGRAIVVVEQGVFRFAKVSARHPTFEIENMLILPIAAVRREGEST